EDGVAWTGAVGDGIEAEAHISLGDQLVPRRLQERRLEFGTTPPGPGLCHRTSLRRSGLLQTLTAEGERGNDRHQGDADQPPERGLETIGQPAGHGAL